VLDDFKRMRKHMPPPTKRFKDRKKEANKKKCREEVPVQEWRCSHPCNQKFGGRGKGCPLWTFMDDFVIPHDCFTYDTEVGTFADDDNQCEWLVP